MIIKLSIYNNIKTIYKIMQAIKKKAKILNTYIDDEKLKILVKLK